MGQENGAIYCRLSQDDGSAGGIWQHADTRVNM